MKKIQITLLGLLLPILCLSQVSEIKFNIQSIDFSLPPRTNISPMSIKLMDNYNLAGAPSAYGSILEIYGKSGHQTSQLYFGGWDNSKIRYREAFYNQNIWSSWITLLDSKNIVESDGVLKIKGTGNSSIFGNLGIGTTDPKAKLHVFGQENGAFNGLVIDNKKNYGSGTGISQTSRIVLSLTENGVPNPLDRIFGIIESGTLSESSSAEGKLSFYVREGGSVNEKLRINSNGNVGIGTTDPKNKLSVNGTIWAKEVKVSLSDAADWVFDANYKLKPLADVEKYIYENKHLPEIPSAEEFRQNDMNLSEMSNKLLQKIEELTLYAIEQQKELDRLKTENENYKLLAERLSAIEKELKK